MRSAIFMVTATLLYLTFPGPAPAETWTEATAVFQERCIECHQFSIRSAGLRLDTFEGVLAGSSLGRVVIPGEPEASELINRVRGRSQPRMPLTGPPLTEDQILVLERWIAAGLPGPEGGAESAR